MKSILLATALSAMTLSLISAPAHATCTSDATDKKLAGAARNSFMKKCETDAQAVCEQSATDMKLAGAARTSHINKCLKDAVGA